MVTTIETSQKRTLNIVTDAFLQVSQKSYQGASAQQYFTLNCSADDKTACNKCLKDIYGAVERTYPIAAGDRGPILTQVGQACSSMCVCEVKDFDMQQTTNINFQAMFNNEAILQQFCQAVIDNFNVSVANNGEKINKANAAVCSTPADGAAAGEGAAGEGAAGEGAAGGPARKQGWIQKITRNIYNSLTQRNNDVISQAAEAMQSATLEGGFMRAEHIRLGQMQNIISKSIIRYNSSDLIDLHNNLQGTIAAFTVEGAKASTDLTLFVTVAMTSTVLLLLSLPVFLKIMERGAKMLVSKYRE